MSRASTVSSGTNCWNGKPLTRSLRPRVLFVRWRQHYNTIRPHSALGVPAPGPRGLSVGGQNLNLETGVTHGGRSTTHAHYSRFTPAQRSRRDQSAHGCCSLRRRPFDSQRDRRGCEIESAGVSVLATDWGSRCVGAVSAMSQSAVSRGAFPARVLTDSLLSLSQWRWLRPACRCGHERPATDETRYFDDDLSLRPNDLCWRRTAIDPVTQRQHKNKTGCRNWFCLPHNGHSRSATDRIGHTPGRCAVGAIFLSRCRDSRNGSRPPPLRRDRKKTARRRSVAALKSAWNYGTKIHFDIKPARFMGKSNDATLLSAMKPIA